MSDSREEALWVSCPECDARPGDLCLRIGEAEALELPKLRIHCARIDMMNLLATMEDD